MPNEETYEMEFHCTNCGNKYLVFIPKGEKAIGHGGTCPYCGQKDYGTFWYMKPRMKYSW